jgi:hypothetical protein
MCLSDIINERLDLWEGEVNVNHGIVSGRTYLTAERRKKGRTELLRYSSVMILWVKCDCDRIVLPDGPDLRLKDTLVTRP